MRLGHNVKRIRTQHGLSQREVARRAAVSQAFIAQLEANTEDNPTLDTLKRLAKALKTTITELVK